MYYDDDRDGLRDASERAIPGRQIFIDVDNDGLLDANEFRTLTDINGAYTLASLNAGNYTIRQALPANWSQSEPASSYSIALEPNQIVNNAVFGSWGIPSLIQV